MFRWQEISKIHSDLYLGGLYTGSVMRVVSENWRFLASKFSSQEQYIKYNEKYEKTSWRAWVMTDDDGRAFGYFATEEAAKKALQEEVSRLIAE